LKALTVKVNGDSLTELKA